MKTLSQLKNIPDNVYIQHALHFRDDTLNLLEKQNDQISLLSLENKQYAKEVKGLKRELSRTILKNNQLQRYADKLDCSVHRLQGKEIDLEKQIEDMVKERKEIDEILKEAERKIEELNKKIKDITEEKHLGKNGKKSTHPNVRLTDSTTSNYPSSYDVHSRIQHSREKSNRKRGGQKGHKVHRLELYETHEAPINVFVKEAPQGAVLKVDENNHEYYAVQEIDLSLKAVVNETRYYISNDGIDLDEKTMNKFKVNAVVYSEHFKAIALYFNCMGVIALKRLCKMFNELTEGTIKVKPSTIVKWTEEFADKSQDFRKAVLAELVNSKVLHVDETSQRVNGKLNWLHVITDGVNVYTILTADRGGKLEGPVFILAQLFHGILVHDHWKPYLSLDQMQHAECNAHILRELEYGVRFENNEACGELTDLLINSLKRVRVLKDEGKTSLPEDEYKVIKEKFLSIIDKELKRYYKENPKIEKKYEEDHIKLFKRLKEFHLDHLLFLIDFDVPFTNNKAENPIRFTKTKQKVSGQFYSTEKGQNYHALLSTIQTTSRKNQNVLQQIEDILKS